MQIAKAQPGVYGARMMGGGFGGCTINLVAVEHVDNFVKHATEDYHRFLGLPLETYQTTIVGGVEIIQAEEAK